MGDKRIGRQGLLPEPKYQVPIIPLASKSEEEVLRAQESQHDFSHERSSYDSGKSSGKSGLFRSFSSSSGEMYCYLCGQECRSRESLKVHLARDHLHWMPYQCAYCCAADYTKVSLLHHLTSFHPEKAADERRVIYTFNEEKYREMKSLMTQSISSSSSGYSRSGEYPASTDWCRDQNDNSIKSNDPSPEKEKAEESEVCFEKKEILRLKNLLDTTEQQLQPGARIGKFTWQVLVMLYGLREIRRMKFPRTQAELASVSAEQKLEMIPKQAAEVISACIEYWDCKHPEEALIQGKVGLAVLSMIDYHNKLRLQDKKRKGMSNTTVSGRSEQKKTRAEKETQRPSYLPGKLA